MSQQVRRLYEQFQPESYELHLDIDDKALTFTGRVSIRGKKVGRPSERLTFHQKQLKITSASVTKHDKKGDQELTVARINNQDSYDEVRLHTDSKVVAGDYTVIMDFEGKITRPMNGIYPCFFKHDEQEKKLIATQFESHHAREAFPCIDEPEAKATFDLTLTTPDANSKTVIANTPVKSSYKESNTVITSFETTPRMSTYLLAFAFGDMDFLEAKTKDGVVVRTYATPENVSHTQFALDVAVKCLEFYNDYFAIPYPLPKCDFIALPDFASGAMENWGCITFREQALIVDEKNTSLGMKQYVANVVAHELTHQWFGNLVTMRWWTDLWLNESFASWMSYLAVDHLFPEWKVWTQFIVDEQGLALKQDALENTHPIQVEVNHPDEIRTIFDAISYEKGASVLHMLHNYLGADDFRDGLRLYLKRHAYNNTEAVDLWAAWEEASKKPIKDFMAAWITKPGYPIVHAAITNDTLNLSQERFYVNPGANKEKDVWPIPLLANKPGAPETFEKQEQVVEAQVDNTFLLNQSRAAFFRTVYDAKHLEWLAKAVEADKLSDLDRLGLLSDAFEAAKAGYGSTVDALKLLEAYRLEDSVVVWDIMAGNIGSIRMVMNDDELRETMKPYVCELVREQVKRLWFDEKPEDTHFDRLLRPVVLGLAANADDTEVLPECLKRFEDMSVPEDIAPDIRGVIYSTAARKGDAKTFDKLLKLHNDSANSEERVTLSAALTNFEQPELADRALGLITSDDVRLQDAGYWIAYSFMNRFARRKTWDWMVSHWDWLQQNMGTDLSFYRMPNYAARVMSDTSFLPEYEEFFAKHMSPAFERPVKQGVETIQWQAAWRERDLTALKAFFKR